MSDPGRRREERARRQVRKLIEEGRHGEARMLRSQYAFSGEPMIVPDHLLRELEPIRQRFLRRIAEQS